MSESLVGHYHQDAEYHRVWIDWDTDEIIVSIDADGTRTIIRLGSTNAHYLATLLQRAVKEIDLEATRDRL